MRKTIRQSESMPAAPAVVPAATQAPVIIHLSHEAIARRAYEIWEFKTRVANDSVRNWIEAEADLRREMLEQVGK